MAARATLCRNLLIYSCNKSYHTLIWNSALYQLNSPKIYLEFPFSHIFSQSKNNKIHYLIERPKIPYLYQPVRYYAKSRDKQKHEKGQKKKVQINEEILSDVINVNVMREQMLGTVERLKDDFRKNLSLRSSSGSIETLPITFEGKDYILQDVAQVVRKNPKTLVINMASFPQIIPVVLQAINKSGMNLNPQQDGTTLFIPIPKVTKEHRENLSKNAKALFVKCRDGIKDVQNKFVKTVKNKEKDGLAKDTSQLICDYIGSVAAEHISEAEAIMEAKQQELLNEL